MSCNKKCPFASQTWPRNLPKPDCRLQKELETVDNPVTKSVIMGMLADRQEQNRQITCDSVVRKR